MDSVFTKSTEAEIRALRAHGATVSSIQREIGRLLGSVPVARMSAEKSIESGPLTEAETKEREELMALACRAELDQAGQSRLLALLNRAEANRVAAAKGGAR